MLTDQFGRVHDYLRISLTERCNLRCLYCMPPEGVQLSPSNQLMNAEEVIDIARHFVQLGIKKIRLTGGEPLVRKDADEILKGLSKLPVELAITTNGILLDTYLQTILECGIKKINISLDTLKEERFQQITRRDYFQRVQKNIRLVAENGIIPKLNVVLIKGMNEDEIVDFMELTREQPYGIQFIEFMPFKGNAWDKGKGVNMEEILLAGAKKYGPENMIKIIDGKNDTSKKYRISGFNGHFGVVSTITNPFCDSCNRIRLTANGRIKNCLFSGSETNLLSAYRNNEDLDQLILDSIFNKKKQRGGILDFNSEQGKKNLSLNRSMVMIGG